MSIYLHKPLKAAFALQDGIVHGYAAQRGGIHSWLDRGYIATGWNKNQRSFMLARATPAPAL
ncbi:MAG: hypothetical protein KKA05_05670 [Alphaproteobacteria bacterium]|nr:hypothetical protein [Alphaproteobacteria bacterium]